jgi:hypothetical protein
MSVYKLYHTYFNDNYRQCNLNLWLNCKFDTGSTAFDMTRNFSNYHKCIINNFTGANVIKVIQYQFIIQLLTTPQVQQLLNL